MLPTVLILLVEDEGLILDMVQTALEEGGYSVVAADDGSSAKSTLDEQHETIAALITDVRLGEGATGWEIARHARHLKPDLPVVYMTGDSGADWAAEGVPKSLLIQKPFALSQIISAVSTLLNEVSSTPTAS